jgi:phosphohistidine swiveling domain-containing protein
MARLSDSSAAIGKFGEFSEHVDVSVPRASAVTTDAYRQHIVGLEQDMIRVYADSSLDDSAALEDLLELLRAEIMARSLDSALLGDIERFLATLPAAAKSVAVRSSATEEDEAGASWAGQFETILNVPRRADAVGDALRKCWASMWVTRTVVYRRRLIANEGDDAKRALAVPAMAVVVQHQLDPKCAGVLFTMDVISGNADHFMAESVFGLGEGVVAGEIDPLTVVVDWNHEQGGDAAVVLRNAPVQRKKYVFRERGGDDDDSSANAGGDYVHMVDTDERERAAPSLDDADIRQLVALGRAVACSVGAPQDIEWAIERDGSLYLLQARNITAFRCTSDAVYAHAAFADQQLFSLSMSGSAYASMMASMAHLSVDHALVKSFFGRVYLSSELWSNYFYAQKELFAERSLDSLFAEFVPRFEARVDQSREQLEPIYRRLMAADGGERLGDVELRAALATLLDFQHAIDVESFTVGVLVEHCENLLKQYLEWLNSIDLSSSSSESSSPPLCLENFTVGVNADSEPKRSADLMTRGARALAAVDSVRAAVASRGADAFRSLQSLSPAAAPPQPLLDFLRAYTRRFFSFSSADEDIAAQPFFDDVTPVYTTLATLIAHELAKPPSAGESLDDVLAELRQGCELSWQPRPIVVDDEHPRFVDSLRRAITTVTMLAGGDHAQQLDQTVSCLRAFLFHKERIHVVYTVSSFMIRRTLSALCLRARYASVDDDASRWIAPIAGVHPLHHAGTLAESHPIFAVPYWDVRTIFAPDAALSSDAASAVARRNITTRRFCRQFEPPATIAEGHQVSVPQDDASASSSSSPSLATSLKGVGASSGVVVGKVVVIDSLSDAHLVSMGDILVTVYTDPSYTMLFSMISAVVIEDGGLLSHAAVVARECNIPAIVQCKHATERIRTGQTIRVDGSTGQIDIVNDD